MKKIFLLVISFWFLMDGFAQKRSVSRNATRGNETAKYSFNQFIGNWQEKERKSLKGDSRVIPNGDTLCFSVANDAGSVLYQGTSNAPIIGTFLVKKGDEIEISLNDYRVLSLSGNTLVLKSFDNPDLHTMTKVPSLKFLTKERKICDNCRIDDLSESLLKQKWISRPQLYVNSFNKSDLAIHTLNITKKKSENVYIGIVTLGNFSMDNTLGRSGTKDEDCTVILGIPGKTITVQSASFNYTGQIYEATDKSLIFTDKKVLIYKLSADKSQKPVNGDPFGSNTIDLSSPANVIHNWYAYNKNADPAFTSAQGLITSLNIVKNLSALSYEGVVSFTDNTRNLITMDCLITFRTPNGETGITIVTKDKTKVWDFQLYKADGKELIFGNKLKDGIQYSFNYQ